MTANKKSRARRESFSLSLPHIVLIGAALAGLFFALVITGPLDTALLRRYCLSHPVAITCVSLFMVGIVNLALKWYQAFTQLAASKQSSKALRRLVTDGEDVDTPQRCDWLSANWKTVPETLRESWFGARITRTIDLQISRGRRHQLEADLQHLADADADRQHDSYSLVRIINWAMPMLGFLGTVLGISQTLGQLDTEMLATQQQEAMNQLTAGLYVAFDTTATALILTVILMFIQFAVSRLELNLLSTIESDSNLGLVEFLADDPYGAQDSLLAPVREMATGLIATIRQLAEDQSSIWARSIAESQSQWKAWTQTASERIETDLGDKIGESLVRHVDSLERLQDEGYRQVDLRWQQWQTTLSDQARQIQGQQKEIIKQSDQIQKLIASLTDLKKLEDSIQDSVSRLENVNRLEEASMCVGEAVAFLATSLERAGVIRGAPIKPRPATTASSASSEDNQNVLPIDQQRKAA